MATEFEAKIPYYYSSYDVGNELVLNTKKRIILVAGPFRIVKGIEFD